MKTDMRNRVERELLTNYGKYYRLAYSYVRNEADALDIVQESAYKAIKNSESINKATGTSAWIYRIIMNTSLDFLRKKKKWETALEDNLETGITEQGYAEKDMMETLAVLEEKDRAILILRYFEELSLEQISRITGENLSTVKSRLYRALKKLRAELDGSKGEEKGKGGII